MASMITDLNDFDLLAIEGADAAKFLQGQLTCNVDSATTTHSVRGAYCNLAGRVIADVRLLPYDGGIYLLCQRSMASVLKTTLDKYIVFSKAKTKIVTQDFVRLGLHGQDADATLHALNIEVPKHAGQIVPTEQGFIYRLKSHEARFELLLHNDQKELLDAIMRGGVAPNRAQWNLAEINAGTVHINPERQDKYTPQLLNYDLLGLVDFKKGCYTGQEIIARMHYRGKAKKRLYLGEVSGFAITAETQFQIENGSLGEIIRFANVQDGTSKFLAILPCDAVEQKKSMNLSNINEDSHALASLHMPTLS